MISATIFGRLTKDPEVRTTQGGTQVCDISIAVNHGKDSQGNEQTTFINCSAFGKTIDTIQKYCFKGTRVCAAADLKMRKYTTQQGQSGAVLEGVINRIDIVDWPDQNAATPPPAAPAPGYQQYPNAAVPQYAPPAAPAAAPGCPPQGAPAYPPQQQAYAQPAAPAYPPQQPYPQQPTGGWTPGAPTPADFPYGANAPGAAR